MLWCQSRAGPLVPRRACAVVLLPACAMRMRRLLLPLAATFLLGGCEVLSPLAVCTDELTVEIRPSSRTIRVGQGFTAQAIGISCGGRERKPLAVEWRSTDPAIARVDSGTGRVIAVAPGEARIGAHDHFGGQDMSWGSVRVRVYP